MKNDRRFLDLFLDLNALFLDEYLFVHHSSCGHGE